MRGGPHDRPRGSTMIHPLGTSFLRFISATGFPRYRSAGDRRSTGFSRQARSAAAAMAVVVLAGFPIASAARTLGTDGLRPAAGPVDRHRAGYGRAWDLLCSAQTHIPVGSSFTVRAPTAQREMHFFMMALGQLRGRQAHPSSYFRHPLPLIGAEARYVLVLAGTEIAAEPELELVVSGRTGSVFRRKGGQ